MTRTHVLFTNPQAPYATPDNTEGGVCQESSAIQKASFQVFPKR